MSTLIFHIYSYINKSLFSLTKRNRLAAANVLTATALIVINLKSSIA